MKRRKPTLSELIAENAERRVAYPEPLFLETPRGFEEPELNSYVFSVKVRDITKTEARKIAEAFRSILDHEGYEETSGVDLAHLKLEG